jgi:hypothetical protein
MSHKTRTAISDVFAYVAISFWYAESRYFGWNWTAQSNAQRLCDSIVIGLALVGLCFWVSALWTKYKEPNP